MASASWEYLQTKETWLREKLIRLLYAVNISRTNYLPDVPALPELGTNDKDRRVLFLLASTSAIGRALVSTPGVRPSALQRSAVHLSRWSRTHNLSPMPSSAHSTSIPCRDRTSRNWLRRP